jgi:hypothetical protein
MKKAIIVVLTMAFLVSAGCSGGTNVTTSNNTPDSSTANLTSFSETSHYTVTSATYKITEQNTSGWRFSYVITVKNNTSSLFLLTGTIQYLDSNGNVVYTEYVYGVNLPGGQSATVTNSSLIDASQAPKVASIKVTFD